MNDNYLYRDKEWIYNQFVNLGKECHEIAKENRWSTRVVRKWANEKYGFNHNFRRDNFKPNDIQLQIIYAGILGDGCLSQRKDIDFTQYIFIQAEEHKDYIEWIFGNLKNMCKHKDLAYIPSQRKPFKKDYNGSIQYFNAQGAYRLSTRGYKFLEDIKCLSKYEIIDRMGDMSIGLYFLDDGYKSKSGIWSLCMGNMSETEVNYFINKLNSIGVYHKSIYLHHSRCFKDKSYYYLRFNKENSNIIDEIILKYLPKDLDIVKKKVGV